MQMEFIDILLVGFAAFVAIGVLARMMNIAREKEMDRFEEELRLVQERNQLQEMLAKKKQAHEAENARSHSNQERSDPLNPLADEAGSGEVETDSIENDGDTAKQAA